MTTAELLALPAAIDIETAGQAFGLGRTKSYELARSGNFPVDVLRLGPAYRVATAEVLAKLGLEPMEDSSHPNGAADQDGAPAA
jgi:hypothetical protein